jgi:hypothetical protein
MRLERVHLRIGVLDSVLPTRSGLQVDLSGRCGPRSSELYKGLTVTVEIRILISYPRLTSRVN